MELAEEEDWSYQHTKSEFEFPILFNYVRYTYRRIAEENKIALSEDGQYCCFNTGLVMPNQEALFASFEVNRKDGPRPVFRPRLDVKMHSFKNSGDKDSKEWWAVLGSNQ